MKILRNITYSIYIIYHYFHATKTILFISTILYKKNYNVVRSCVIYDILFNS